MVSSKTLTILTFNDFNDFNDSKMKNVLTAENINFGYSQGNLILEDFNFQITQGGMTGLIGPNGAGKSTALKILSGFLSPSSGKVLLQENNLNSISNAQRAKVIAVVGQNIFNPLPFTVREIVEMGRTLRISRFSALKSYDMAKIESAMSEMDVLQFADKQFNQLSGGEKQRVKIAAALAQEPEILLLDEPTSQLDMGHSIHLMKHLRRINHAQNISILLVSHDIQLIAGFMQEFVLMKNGKIIAQGNSATVLQPSLIEKAYGCPVEVRQDKTYGIQIMPKLL